MPEGCEADEGGTEVFAPTAGSKVHEVACEHDQKHSKVAVDELRPHGDVEVGGNLAGHVGNMLQGAGAEKHETECHEVEREEDVARAAPPCDGLRFAIYAGSGEDAAEESAEPLVEHEEEAVPCAPDDVHP